MIPQTFAYSRLPFVTSVPLIFRVRHFPLLHRRTFVSGWFAQQVPSPLLCEPREKVVTMININVTDKIFGDSISRGFSSPLRMFSRRTFTTTPHDPEGAMKGTTSDTKMDGDEDEMEYRHPQLVYILSSSILRVNPFSVRC
jgi:hypothetical protein